MHKKINIKKFLSEKRKKSRGKYKKAIFIKKRTRMGIEKLSDFVYSKTKRNKSLNKGGPTIMKKKKLIFILALFAVIWNSCFDSALQLVVHQAETTKTLTKVETKKH